MPPSRLPYDRLAHFLLSATLGALDSSDLAFWEDRYHANRTPWELPGAPPALLRFLAANGVAGRVLIPGCGIGHEVRAFVQAGWPALAIDYSPAAIDRARHALGALGDRVKLADFFRDDLGGPFELVYERAFLCSMAPHCWRDYAQRMAEIVRPGGCVVGIFTYGAEPEPPPHLMSDTAANPLRAAGFTLVDDQPIPASESPPMLADAERWQAWRRT